jgi:tetratricopeptide (TPR) repeat protein
MTDQKPDLAQRLGLKRVTGEAYYRRGLKAHESGDLENAILDISEAIYYDRGYAEYYSTRGLFYIEANQLPEAELDLRYALRLSKRQWLAQYGLGIINFQRGDFSGALEYLTNALKFGGRRAEVWFYRAVTNYSLANYERAAEDMDTAISLFPATDKRLKDARTWKREIDDRLPESAKKANKPAAKKAQGGKKAAQTDADTEGDSEEDDPKTPERF